MASFNAIFLGFNFEMNTVAEPSALQFLEYPGINGVGVINHGSRGGLTLAEGALFGVDAASLAVAIHTFRSMQVAKVKAVLIDQYGTAWPAVRLLDFQPYGRNEVLVGGGFAKRYRAQFLHTL